jgi:uncharacterized damage-inducible protein DinB
MRRVHVLTGALILAVFSTAAGPAGAQGTDDATIASVKTTYEVVKGYITKAAAQVPEDTYKFQPTKEVRTMGQLFGHIANANGMICGTASGMKPASSGDAEKLATKAEIQKALADSFAACDHAFSMINPANANEPVKLFGMAHTRIGAMAFNNAHDFEHYGNIVTYMRINKMVPPSSGGKD